MLPSRLPAALALTLTLPLLAACGNDDPTGALAAAEGGLLTGDIKASGSSAQEAAMTAWIAGYQSHQPGVLVQYDAIGSGGGRENLIAGATDLGGTDAFLDEKEREAVEASCGPGGALHVPVYISPIALPYNLPGVEGLQLRPATIAGIMDLRITSWDDPAIQEDNPGTDLPATDITVVHRSDDSGTTENFLEYLTAAAPEAWPHEVDKAWPVPAEAAPQNTGVIQVVESTEGAIGYADASVVTGSSVAVGVGGEFVTFSPEAAARVVDASEPVVTGVPGDLALDLARDTTASGAYPIVLVSYHVACTSYERASRAELVKDFLHYVVSEEGQATAAEAAGSSPISDSLREQADSLIDTIDAG
ncbi:phosphate ABC transporter substrate-binding protein PstS [Ornithinimicrobium cerasi]|uniref:phosphate ABC transporter substrate-binding protein PstS n=1 Tax=Ornithinimicrobium cerasi TaxID=2248773 RepID=UPI000EFE4C5C|nr:phosphate ABC transporter substrate-binding protein PstS [Ornithinimicrobium cerasi]